MQILLRILPSALAILFLGCSQAPQNADSGAVSVDTLVAKEAVPELGVTPKPVTNLWTRTIGEDWPSFLGPRGDGTSIEKGINPDLWTPHPKLAWILPLGTSYGGPSISQGRLLQYDRVGAKEQLSCYNAETMERLWQWDHAVEYEDMYGFNNGPRCSPVIDGDVVYCFGVSGHLACVAVADGQLVWQRDLNREYGVITNFFGVASTPYVYQDLLLVMVGGSPKSGQAVGPNTVASAEPNGTGIIAFDKRTGREVYRVGDELASYSSPCVRTFFGKDVGLALVRSGLLAWDARTGKQLFRHQHRAKILESVNAAQPIVDGDKILVSEAYEIGSDLIQVTMKDDQWQVSPIWQDGKTRSDQCFRAHWSTPVLIDGYLYGCSGRNEPDSDFRCVRLADRKVMWSKRMHERSSLISIDGFLIVLGENGLLELIRPTPDKLDVVRSVNLNEVIDPNDGAPLISSPAWAAPIVSHGLLFIRGNHKLLCFDLTAAPGS